MFNVDRLREKLVWYLFPARKKSMSLKENSEQKLRTVSMLRCARGGCGGSSGGRWRANRVNRQELKLRGVHNKFKSC
jgi:hypothetical protein